MFIKEFFNLVSYLLRISNLRYNIYTLWVLNGPKIFDSFSHISIKNYVKKKFVDHIRTLQPSSPRDGSKYCKAYFTRGASNYFVRYIPLQPFFIFSKKQHNRCILVYSS